MTDQTPTTLRNLSTGIPGLDELLRGGLTRDRMYLLEGTPGTGKTTLALQFLLTGRDLGERTVRTDDGRQCAALRVLDAGAHLGKQAPVVAPVERQRGRERERARAVAARTERIGRRHEPAQAQLAVIGRQVEPRDGLELVCSRRHGREQQE